MANAFVTKIQKLWKNIEESYKEGEINSESALQCVMYGQLRKYCDKERLKIFVEPTIFIKDKILVPDMLIVKNNTIKFVIELKYITNNYVGFRNDWRKFYWLWEQQKQKVKVGNKVKGEDFTVNIKYFIFAYIDKCYRNDNPEGDISTPKKVDNFINKSNLKCPPRGRYIQLHGDVKEDFTWKVCLH